MEERSGLGVRKIAVLLPFHSLVQTLAANRNCESFAKQVLLCGRLATSQYHTRGCGEEIANGVHFRTLDEAREGREYEPASVLLERIRAERTYQASVPAGGKRKPRKASAHV